MIMLNKYNRKLYKLISCDDKKVTLEREDKSRFTINKSEFLFYYIAYKEGAK